MYILIPLGYIFVLFLFFFFWNQHTYRPFNREITGNSDGKLAAGLFLELSNQASENIGRKPGSFQYAQMYAQLFFNRIFHFKMDKLPFDSSDHRIGWRRFNGLKKPKNFQFDWISWHEQQKYNNFNFNFMNDSTDLQIQPNQHNEFPCCQTKTNWICCRR